jgi:hypothetical protein
MTTNKLSSDKFFFFSQDIPGQHASLSWYPPIRKFEASGKNAGRWTEMEDTEFLLREHHNTHQLEGPENLDTAKKIKRGPLPVYKWNNSLRGSSDVHKALLRINKEARVVIETAAKRIN